jgi:hypothetical protein
MNSHQTPQLLEHIVRIVRDFDGLGGTSTASPQSQRSAPSDMPSIVPFRCARWITHERRASVPYRGQPLLRAP